MEQSGTGGGNYAIGNAVLIAGPTASGKSALALDIARASVGVVVNADSMQVYDGPRILTARPDDAHLALAPHHLYGHVPPQEAYSTGRWLRDVEALAHAGRFAKAPAVIVGGTGLYFRGLLQGLSEMPAIPDAIRTRWRYRLSEEGPDRLHRLLMIEDRDTAMILRPTDGQRIVRALEVLEASGRSIRDWQATAGRPLVDPRRARRIVFDPPREMLVQRIEDRLDAMIGQGVLDEVQALEALNLDPALPATKAIGLREFARHLRGEISLDEALSLAKTATRQYARRQVTWFRNQLSDAWTRIRDGGDLDSVRDGR